MLNLYSVFRTGCVAALVAALGLATLHSARAEESPPTPRELARAGRFDEARDAARTALAASPADAALGRLLQDVLLELGEREAAVAAVPAEAPAVVQAGLRARLLTGKDAVKALGAATKDDDAPMGFRLDLARAQLNAGNESAAEATVTSYLKQRPNDADALALLGAILAARGKDTAAREVLEQVLEATPGHALAAITLAQVLARGKTPAESRTVLEAALTSYPKHPTLLLALADDQVRMGELDAALVTLAPVLDLPTPKADVHARMAAVQRAKEAYPEAERCAAAALALVPEHTDALRTRGFVKLKRGDLDGAMDDYAIVLRLRPEWALIHADIALVHIVADRAEDAETSAEAAIKLDDNLIDAHLRLGQAMFLQGKGKQAKVSYEKVLKLDADNVAANRSLGYVLLDEGKPKNAIKHFQVVADADEKDSSSMRMIGRCELASGRVEEAVTAFREAVARDEKDGFAWFDLGKGLEKQEKWEEAITAYERAIAADPKLTHPHLYLAELYDEVQGEPEKALPHYKRYLELAGDDEGDVVKKRVEQLEKK
ncbi:MAG: tetratricopeptide repeat protein [Planctomycetota bacterium]|nr:tetratricopeptide repeat protein [Planctomycetota bacterium]